MLATDDLLRPVTLRQIAFEGDIRDLERHPLSAFFGDMSDSDRNEFRENFEVNPRPELCRIVLYDGQILDGWHRTQTALDTGHEDLLEFYIYEGDDPAEYAIMLNGSRRHQDSAARAMAITQCREWMKVNTPGHSMTNEQAAQAANVSTRQINRANRVSKAGLEALVPEIITLEDAYDIAMDDDLLFEFHSGAKTIDECVDVVQERRRAKRDERDLRRLTGEGAPSGQQQGSVVSGSPGQGSDEPPPWDADIGPAGPWEPPPAEPPPSNHPTSTETGPQVGTQLKMTLIHSDDCCSAITPDEQSRVRLLDHQGVEHVFQVVGE